MNKKESFQMLSDPGRRRKERSVTIQDRKKIGAGSEVETSKVRLRYGEFNKPIDGLVLRKFHYSEEQPDWAEQHLDSVMRQWNKIKEIARRRKKNSKPCFNLPGTIRGFRNGNERGVVMTDLTEGGKKEVFDLKELNMGYGHVDRTTWESIREQIEQDIQVAEEEGVYLGGSTYPLDPWLVVMDNDSVKVYIADIGGYTSVGVHESMIERSTHNLKTALKAMDAEMQLQF